MLSAWKGKTCLVVSYRIAANRGQQRSFRFRLNKMLILHYNPNYAVFGGYMGYIMREKDT